MVGFINFAFTFYLYFEKKRTHKDLDYKRNFKEKLLHELSPARRTHSVDESNGSIHSLKHSDSLDSTASYSSNRCYRNQNAKYNEHAGLVSHEPCLSRNAYASKSFDQNIVDSSSTQSSFSLLSLIANGNTTNDTNTTSPPSKYANGTDLTEHHTSNTIENNKEQLVALSSACNERSTGDNHLEQTSSTSPLSSSKAFSQRTVVSDNEEAKQTNDLQPVDSNSNGSPTEEEIAESNEMMVVSNTDDGGGHLAQAQQSGNHVPVLSFQTEIDEVVKKRIDDKLRECSSESDSDVEPTTYRQKGVDLPSAQRLAKRLYFLDGFKANDVVRHLSKK